jgi:transcriptional regulator with XRE-family HTH domain
LLIDDWPATRPVLVNMQDGLSRKKKSIKEAAALLGVPHSSVSRMLHGEYPATAHYMLALAEWLEAPPGWPLVSWDIAERVFGARGQVSGPRRPKT